MEGLQALQLNMDVSDFTHVCEKFCCVVYLSGGHYTH